MALQDFEEMLSELSAMNARYLIVGAHAVMHYTRPRYTKELDIWIEPTLENAKRVWQALARFGSPLKNLTVKDLTTDGLIYQLGVEPYRIDILTGIEGCTFETARRNRQQATFGDTACQVLSRDDLVRAKRAAGRPQDLIDLEALLAASVNQKSRVSRPAPGRSARSRKKSD